MSTELAAGAHRLRRTGLAWRPRMSPTIVRAEGVRLYFFSREESRVHIHARAGRGMAKIWIEPVIEVAENRGLTRRQLAVAARLVRRHEREIREAWKTYFGR